MIQIYKTPLFCIFFLLSTTIFAQPGSITNLNCGTPASFALTSSGFVGDNPTTAASSCGQCCYAGSDLDGDGDQDVSFSVENSRWYQYCNSTGSPITTTIIVDEVNNVCNVQGAVFVGPSNNMDVDCSNPGFQEFGSNPGGNADGFSFTVTIPAGQCAWVMIDGYGGATCPALTIEVPCCTAPTLVSAGTDRTICAGASTTLIGIISGGLVEAGGPTFSWSPVSGLSCPTCASTTASPTSTTTYTLTACNSNDLTACCLTDAVVVTVIPAFVASAGSDVVACAPSTVTIGGAPTGPAGSTYAWAVSGANNAGIAITAGATTANPTVTINAGATGSETYQVTVTNSGCSYIDQVIVTVGPLAVSAGVDRVICAGTSIGIGGAPTAPAGSTFSWSCTSCAGITMSSSTVANPTLTAGAGASGVATYTVTATLGTCVNTDAVSVTVNPLPSTPTATASPVTVCAGSNSTLTAAGGAGAGTYTWWDAASGGTQIGAGNTLVVSPGSTTTYFIQSTNATTGCVSLRGSVVVNTTVAAVAAAGADNAICQNNTYTLSGSIANPEACGTQTWTVVSGTGTFSPDANTLNAVFTPTSTGNVELRLTPCSSGGICPVAPDNIIINVRPSPTVTASSSEDTLCMGEPLIADLTSATVGGTPATPITTSFSSTGGSLAIPNNDCATGASMPITVSGITDPLVGATTVSVCVNIDLNNVDDIQIRLCAPGGSPCVTLLPAPNNGLAGNDMTNTCFTDASATDIASGVAPFTGSFNPYGAATLSSLAGSATNGIWTLTVFDCAGGASGDLDGWNISFQEPPPSGPYTYNWSPPAGIAAPTEATTTFSPAGFPVSTVTKTITSTDANGCTGTQDVTIKIVDCTILLDLERPLKLLNFRGKKVATTNLLEWEVVSEDDTDYYVIEKSTDGVRFNQHGLVSAIQATQQYTYQFWDNLPGVGTHYYRIQIFNIDGTYEYSKTIALTHDFNTATDGLAIFPNPTKDAFFVEFNSDIQTEVKYELQNAIGQKVLVAQQNVQIGLNRFKIDIQNLPAASYILSVVFNDKNIQRKIIKQ